MRAVPRFRVCLSIAAGLIVFIFLLIGADFGAAESSTSPYLDPAYSSKLLQIVQDQAAWQDALTNGSNEDIQAQMSEARLAAIKDSLPKPKDLGNLAINSNTGDSWRYRVGDTGTWQVYELTMGSGLGTADPYSLPCNSAHSTTSVTTSWSYAPNGDVVLQTANPPSQAYPGAGFSANVSGNPIWALTFTGADPSWCNPFRAQLAFDGGLSSFGLPTGLYNDMYARMGSTSKGEISSWPSYYWCESWSLNVWFGNEPTDGHGWQGACSSFQLPLPTVSDWHARWMDASGIPNDPKAVSRALSWTALWSNTGNLSATTMAALNWNLAAAREVIGADGNTTTWVNCELTNGPTSTICKPPTFTLSAPSPSSSPIRNNLVSFDLDVDYVFDPSGTVLTATVTGANPQTISATVEGRTARFSYTGTHEGVDTVQVSGSLGGYTISSNSKRLSWVVPTLTLSEPSDSIPCTRNGVSFNVDVGNVADASGAVLTARVSGANPQILSATVHGTTATFSDSGDQAGSDTVQVSGTIANNSIASNDRQVFWRTPTLTLSEPSDPNPVTGDEVSFDVEVGNVPNASGTVLSATISGANPQTLSATVDGTTASFYYIGAHAGIDRVQVSGTIVNNSISSNVREIDWESIDLWLQENFGLPGDSLYALEATMTWADPVNSATGNFYQSLTDASVPAAGIPFSFVRTYNSRDDSVGPIGRGWSASPYVSLTTDRRDNVTLAAGNGQAIRFVRQQDGSFVHDANVTAELEKTDSGYELVQKSRDAQSFDSNGRMVSWLDPNRQGLHFSYDSSGIVSSIIDSGGREYDLGYDAGGRLTSVSLPDGTSLAYGYNGDLLTSFTDQTGARTTYFYDSRGYLKSAVDGSGKLLFQNVYDDQGRVVTQEDAAGNKSTFDWSDEEAVATDAAGSDWKDVYNDSGQLSTRTEALGNKTTYDYDDANDLTALTDPLGNKTTMTYDDRGNMLSQANALGGSESWTYDDQNNIISHTDALGNITTYTYDSRGNRLSETDPLGNTTRCTYDLAGRRTAIIDPLDRTTRSVYDDEGNLIEKILPSGAKTTYTYDSLGNELTETDPLGHTTTNTYDATGNLLKTVDPLGNTTTSTYDGAGRLLSDADARGATTRYLYDANGRQIGTDYPDGTSTHTTYDALGNVISSTDTAGKVTRFEYDADGRQTATISPDGERTETKYDAAGSPIGSTDPLDKNTVSKYDALGRQIETTNPLNRTTKTVYDAAGNVVETVDALGNVTTKKFDADGRVIETTDPLGHTTKSSYDAAGQLISETDRNAGITLHSYDADGREVSTTDPSGAVITSTYDAAGNKLSETDPLGHTTTHTYNADGNQVSSTNPLGETTTYSYDANGNQVTQADPLEALSKTVYNVNNQEIEQIDPLGRKTKTAYDLSGNAASTTDPLGNTTSYSYDGEGRLVKTTDPLGNSTTSAYDKAGKLVSKTDANGHTTTYAYDAVGEKITTTAPGGAVTSFSYDANGNLVKRVDAKDHEIAYSYDADGNKLSKTDALGRKWHYSYDANGNLIATKTPSGGKTSQSYDASNRLVSKSYSDGTPSVSYAYDLAGNKISMTDGTGETTYAYDEANQLVGSSGPSGNFIYAHDSDGNVTSRTYPNGLKTSYTYNAAGEMTTAKAGRDKTYYIYDANGKLSSTLHPNGILDTRSYDAAGRLSDISSTDSKGKPLYSRSYSYDAAGNPLSLQATAPRDHTPGWWGKLWYRKGVKLTKWSESYSYDSRNRLVKACMDESCSRYFDYSYDSVGNRVQLETKEATTTYTYDQADELLKATKEKSCRHHCQADVTDYAYDQNGNETKAGETSYAYNLANELTEEAQEHGRDKVSYAYTADGLMATRSARKNTTSYTWDTSSGIANLAIESDSTGHGRFGSKDAQSFTYGNGPLGIVEWKDTLTFHTDATGSVVELSNEHGRVSDSYRYTPFGESYGPGESDEAPSEISENPIRYAGQYLDSESDLYYMRARQYDPETGRFLETDPLTCDEACSSTYVYAENNPTLLVDPSGMGAMYSFYQGPFYGAEYLNPQTFPVPGSCWAGLKSQDYPWCNTYGPKAFTAIVTRTGAFTWDKVAAAGASWTSQNINQPHNGWRLCSGYDSNNPSNSCSGIGPNWVFNEENSSTNGGDQVAGIENAAQYGTRHYNPNAIGYVFVAQDDNWGGRKNDPPGVHITRHLNEAFGERKPWAIGFPGWKSQPGVPTVVVKMGTQPGFKGWLVGLNSYNVCSQITGKWIGLYAEAGRGDEIGDVSSSTKKWVKIALDSCSEGKGYPLPLFG
ncbi:MAG: RHS repeat-associated core domain-containing protein [Gaiellaceae bacterium]